MAELQRMFTRLSATIAEYRERRSVPTASTGSSSSAAATLSTSSVLDAYLERANTRAPGIDHRSLIDSGSHVLGGLGHGSVRQSFASKHPNPWTSMDFRGPGSLHLDTRKAHG
jgi:hypothetical protein